MKLTDQQHAFFDTFGFLKFTGLFRDEAQRIIDAFERVWRENGGGHHGRQHDPTCRSSIGLFIDQNEYLSSLLDDPRIEGAIASILGDDFNYTSSDGNYYAGDTRWHSDRYTSGFGIIKLSFYLDPVGAENGCLRVIPGSHRCGDGFADELDRWIPKTGCDRTHDVWCVDGSEVPAYPIESEPGDMLLFVSALKHSAWGGGNRRRMLALSFQRRYGADSIDELRADIGGMARSWIDKPYGDVMVRTAGPGRMVHLEQRLAHGDHLPQLVAEAKQTMSEPTRGGAQWDQMR